MKQDDRQRFGKVEEKVRLSRYGGDCYAYCMLAAGHVDLVIETELKPYDIVALIPVVTGAGGIITSWDGRPATKRRPHHRGRRRAHAQGRDGRSQKLT